MTAKEWLSRGYKLDKEINALITAHDRAFELACIASKSNTDERVQTSRLNVSENKYIEYSDYSREIDIRIDRLIQIKREIQTAIDRVDDTVLRALLIERYINFKTWEQVAEAMKLSEKWVRTSIHDRALAAIDEVRDGSSAAPRIV